VTGSIEELQEQITEVGEREGARVRITDEMEARLTGLGFKIEAITVERQAIDPTGVTRWKWQIEPTETGTRHLHLTLTGFIDLERSRRQLTIRTFERTLLIKVTWQDRVMGFFGDNWQWLWTALFVPLLLWWLQRRRTRRAGPTAPTTSGS
jgi:hypothetical protein